MSPSQQRVSGDSVALTRTKARRSDVVNSGYLYPADYPSISGTDTGNLLEYWRILNRRRGTLLIFGVLSILAGYGITKLETPVYRARTLLQIESLNEDFLNMRNISPTEPLPANSESPEYNIRTQITILQSRPVLERTLQKQNLEKRIVENQERHRGWFSSKQQIHASRPAEVAAAKHEEAVRIATEALRIRPEPNTRVLEVSFESTDPKIASDLANSLTSAFTETSMDNRWRSTQNTSAWLTRQLQDVKVKLEKAQDELQRYARGANLTFLSQTGMDTTSQERLKQLELEVSKAVSDRIAAQSKYELAATAPVDSLPEIVDNATLKDYQVQLTGLREKLADLSSNFTPSYPKVVSLRAQIQALESALEKQRANITTRTRNEYAAAARREKLVNAEYASVVALMSEQGEKLDRYQLLKREVDTTRQLYESMVQKVKEADLALAMKATDVDVIERALPPGSPYKPVAALNMGLGLISGLFLGSMVIIQRARANTRIQEPGDSILELGVPELGVISAGNPAKPSQFQWLLGKPATPDTKDVPELVTLQHAASPLAEQFNIAAASLLLYSRDETSPRVIAVSSANA
ncbi:MAG: GumC family protein, partial [Acidobacteriaceae bacterium]|nr:GumC family protein [Acidobacteriaceae bacterium]